MHSYKAYFRKRVKIIELPNPEEKTLDLSFSEEGQVFTARASKVFQKQQEKIAKGWNNISFWPKTNDEGELSQETEIRHIFTQGNFEEKGIVIGKLVESQKERIVVEIHPKREEKFNLVLKTSSEIIEACEGKENQSISIVCEIDKENLSIIAKSVAAIE